MSCSSKAIDRIVYGEVPETCPHVDKALEDAAEKIKIQTGKLRDSLREYVERAVAAESELEEAKSEIQELKEYIAQLERQIDSME